MAIEETKQAAKNLASQAHEVGRVSGREPWREVLRWASRGRLGRQKMWPDVPELGTPWQDTVSANRIGWRQRAANLDDEFVFAVDYQICRRCRLGWGEEPHTMPGYQRCGLASAGLAALRSDHPGLSWHTLGGHSSESQLFWAAVGAGVAGGYERRALCSHVHAGG
ncbi:hypothetical protein [Streptomyces sp. NPDC051016]|uniref:hypothetical protein n=1 Tax=Streptomyces sp. NPDC051016 TaxID=3365638 RepID=UPI0037AD8A0A